MNNDLKRPLNTGHRKRLKEKFINDSRSFSDLDLLELLLHYSIARKDTAEIAKTALSEFGSLKYLINASFSEITKINGLGENSAVLIKLINRLDIETNNSSSSNICIENIRDALNYIKKLPFNKNAECLYAVGLNNNYELTGIKLLAEGTSISVIFSVKDVLKFAVQSSSDYVILAHNHIKGKVNPSKEDIELTDKCASYLGDIDIRLIDHIIVNESESFSFAVNNLTDSASFQYI